MGRREESPYVRLARMQAEALRAGAPAEFKPASVQQCRMVLRFIRTRCDRETLALAAGTFLAFDVLQMFERGKLSMDVLKAVCPCLEKVMFAGRKMRAAEGRA